jgi:hypothetical protein
MEDFVINAVFVLLCIHHSASPMLILMLVVIRRRSLTMQPEDIEETP